MIQKTATTLSFLTGLAMIFLGARFLLFPEQGETGYGIHFNEQGDYSFHYIKGIRDVFSGIVICLLVLARQSKALGITMLAGTIIPLVDLLIVVSKDDNGLVAALPHSVAILVCSICGIVLLNSNALKQSV